MYYGNMQITMYSSNMSWGTMDFVWLWHFIYNHNVQWEGTEPMERLWKMLFDASLDTMVQRKWIFRTWILTHDHIVLCSPEPGDQQIELPPVHLITNGRHSQERPTQVQYHMNVWVFFFPCPDITRKTRGLGATSLRFAI